MNSFAVNADMLSKRFVSLQTEKTLLRFIRSFCGGSSAYKETLVLKDLTFNLNLGDKIALIGGNGAGKTTLLRVLAGIYEITSGTLNIVELPTAFFRFWIGSSKELSVIETARLLSAIYRIPAQDIDREVENILDYAELSEQRDSQSKVLSSGQYQRLALSVFFHVKSDFVIFDEGLSYLDIEFQHKCEKYFQNLASSTKTVIMTSHDNSFLRKYCKTGILLEDGKLIMKGEIEDVLRVYEGGSR